MNFTGILIGTGILWMLNSLVVNPVAQLLTKTRNKELQLSYEGGQVASQEKSPPRISTGYYILVDVVILGIAGFLLGRLFGWFFIGFTWKAKSWPGMIVFIATSIVGSLIHG